MSVSSRGGQLESASGWPSMNADGSLVAYASWATNVLPRRTDITPNIYVWGCQRPA